MDVGGSRFRVTRDARAPQLRGKSASLQKRMMLDTGDDTMGNEKPT